MKESPEWYQLFEVESTIDALRRITSGDSAKAKMIIERNLVKVGLSDAIKQALTYCLDQEILPAVETLMPNKIQHVYVGHAWDGWAFDRLKAPVVYTPPKFQRADLDTFVEVWVGLPEVPFQEAQAQGGGTALKYELHGEYIWVTPDAYRGFKIGETVLFSASLKNQDKRHAFAVNPEEGDPEDYEEAIKNAMRTNLVYRLDGIREELKE